MECSLTQDQLKRIEENRLLALKKLQTKQQQSLKANGSLVVHKQQTTPQSISTATTTNTITTIVKNGIHFVENTPISNIANEDRNKQHIPQTPSVKKYFGNIHFELFSKSTFSVNDITVLSSIFKSTAGFKYSTFFL